MPPWQCYQDILLQPGGNEDLSLALPHQLSLPIEFARFAQMCITLDNQARIAQNYAIQPSLPLTQNAEPAPNPISAPSNGGGDPMDLSKASSAPRSPHGGRKEAPVEYNLYNYCGGVDHYANTWSHQQRLDSSSYVGTLSVLFSLYPGLRIRWSSSVEVDGSRIVLVW